MHRLALAFQFLTLAPWPRSTVRQPEDLGASMAFYPVVGAAIGIVLLSLYLLGARIFPDGVLCPGLVILLIIFTGGLHLDGLADVCDGFYAGRTPAEALRIMKDPHLGTMGVVGITSVILMKAVLLSFLPSAAVCTALLIMPAMSRTGMVWGAHMAPYARSEGGTGAIFFQTLQARHVWLATVLLAFWTTLWGGWAAALLLTLTWVVTKLFVGICQRRIGGMTGDTLGALNELLELLTLICYYPLLRWQIVPMPILYPRLFFP